ncbi:hypothetical protein MRX96_020237 [Rhipicephalus microplus]
MFTPLLTFQIVACWVADTVGLGDCAWSPPGDLPVPIAPSSHLDQPRISSPIVSPLIPARACSYAWQRFSSSTSPTTWGQCGLHNLHNITKSSGHDTGWRKMFTPLLTFQIVACWVADTVGLGDCAWSPPGDLPVPIAPSSHLDQPRISSPIVSPLIPARACSYAWQRFSSSTSPTTTSLTLRTYTNEPVKPCGVAFVAVQYNAQRQQLPLYVLRQDGQPLLGRSWLQHLKLDWTQIQGLHHMQVGNTNGFDRSPKLESLLNRYRDLFKDELGTVKGEKATLFLRVDAKPRFFKARSVPFALRATVEQELSKLQ